MWSTRKCTVRARALRPAALLALVVALPLQRAAAQVELTLQGGIHASRLERPERLLSQPGPMAMTSARGEATTVGLRVGSWRSAHWGVDAGLAWSRNHSWQGSTALPVPRFETQTVFTSATLRVRPSARASRVAVSAAVGPALIIHRGTGTSLLSRQTDVGAVVGAGAQARVASRLGLRLDLQEYLFSSRFADAYTPMVSSSPIEPAGSRFRHEFVVLVGATLQLGQ